MTNEELTVAKTLGGVSFPLGTRRKEFAYQMAAVAERDPARAITPRQRRYLFLLAIQ